jgi:hypothetical protein
MLQNNVITGSLTICFASASLLVALETILACRHSGGELSADHCSLFAHLQWSVHQFHPPWWIPAMLWRDSLLCWLHSLISLLAYWYLEFCTTAIKWVVRNKCHTPLLSGLRRLLVQHMTYITAIHYTAANGWQLPHSAPFGNLIQ